MSLRFQKVSLIIVSLNLVSTRRNSKNLLFQKDATLRFFHVISPLRTLYVNGSTADKNHIQCYLQSICSAVLSRKRGLGHWGARSFSLQKRYLQNFFLQNISLQRLFLQEFFSTEVIPTQRLNLQHNIPTEFLSTLPSSYIPFFIQRLYLQENFSEKIYHKFLFQRTE